MNLLREERIMAVDYGEKRIGLALSDPLRIFAYPYKTILNNASLWKELDRVITENGVVSIILGYPTNSDGTRSTMTNKVENFMALLKSRYKLEVLLWDERYSSSIAMDNILSSVTSKKKRRDKGLVDRNAAAVILREYLDNGLNTK